ncbi:hypothetical protein BJ508DRAFT_333585 [Ascobolus immersus RN42]|uniref:Uncharacterized protein n=1 Tax=Ascobolus immersus RN42 TaxID=1160509 RepID=A0A3N4HM13_ASCIM|nr:hypothetical protein BJ508DRAFT_333585 [Ascobolus immersus RN42]
MPRAADDVLLSANERDRAPFHDITPDELQPIPTRFTSENYQRGLPATITSEDSERTKITGRLPANTTTPVLMITSRLPRRTTTATRITSSDGDTTATIPVRFSIET